MSDKRPDETNPKHIPSPEGRPLAPPRPTPPPYTGKRPAIPHPAGPGARRPAPYPPNAERRPAVHPTTGERPKRRTLPEEHPPQRTTSDETAKRPRPPGYPTPRNQPPEGYPRRRPTREGRDFLSPDKPPGNPDTDTHNDSPPPRRRARRRTQFALFNIVAIVFIAIICLTIFAMSFESIFARDPEASAAATPTPVPTPTPLPINTQNLTGMITNLNEQSNPRTITMHDINTNHSREFAFLDTTALANRTGTSIIFSALAVGNMMDVAYNPDTNELLDLRQSFTRDFHSRTGVNIDMENTSITLGNDVLNFTSQTLVLYRGEPALISDINQDDIITIVAVGDTIWLIEIESSHGVLQVTNASSIMNGRMVLEPLGTGVHRVVPLNDIGSEGLNLPEGTYRITVEGTNIETYITELAIHHGETTILDLAGVEPGVAVLELTVTPAGASVFINGELRADHREPMEFDFGASLTIRVEREGYVTQERTVEMSQLTTTSTINLEIEIITSLVTIVTEPIGANVWINNVPKGQSPVLTELTPGTHNVSAQMPGYHDVVSTIYVPEGDSLHALTLTRIAEPPPYTQEPYQSEPYTPESPAYSDNEDDD